MTAKKVAKPAEYVLAAVDVAKGMTVRKAQEVHTSLSHDDVRFCRRWVKASAEEFTEAIRVELRRSCGMLLEEIQKRIEKIPPSSLAMTYGILTDKLAALEMMPSTIRANLNVGFGPRNLSREEVVAALTGKKDPEKEKQED